MIGGDVLRWALITVFTATSVSYLVVACTDRGWPVHTTGGRTTAALHVVMSIAMLATQFGWGAGIPTILTVLVFTAATLWFAAKAVFVPAPLVAAGVGVPGPGPANTHSHGGGPWYHAAMMASMVWMSVVMSALSTDVVGTTVGSGGATDTMPGMNTGAMPGMDMGPTSGTTTSTATGPLSTTDPLWWMHGLSVVLCVAFFCAAAWLTALVVRGRTAPHTERVGEVVGDGLGVVMAVGMALAFLQMA